MIWLTIVTNLGSDWGTSCAAHRLFGMTKADWPVPMQSEFCVAGLVATAPTPPAHVKPARHGEHAKVPAGAPDGMVRYEPAAQVVVLPLAGVLHAPEVRLPKLPTAQAPPLMLVHWYGCPLVAQFEGQPLQALRLPVHDGCWGLGLGFEGGS